MATQFNRTVFRGDTIFFFDNVFQDLQTRLLFTVPVTNPASVPPPGAVPFDITGSRIWFTLKNTVVDPDAQAIAQLDNLALLGVTFVTPASGLFSVNAPALVTSGFPDSPVDLVFDIQILDTTSRISTLEFGTLTVTPDVTRVTS